MYYKQIQMNNTLDFKDTQNSVHQIIVLRKEINKNQRIKITLIPVN